MNNKVIAVVGPTASGKSSAAFKLASITGGEIISCDSMQLYRGMNIGTAKPTAEEMSAVRHHLIDVVDPSENFSCSEYTVLARQAIYDVLSRDKLPIVCGGTGLYMESAIYDRTMTSPGADPAIREMLEKRTDDENFAELVQVDPQSAEKIHKNNRKRVIRALEIFKASGITKTQWDAESKLVSSGFDATIAVLYASDREYLYRRIDDRVDQMMQQGLLDEVRSLKLSQDTTAGQAIGYKEFYGVIDGSESLENAVEKLKQATRNYAKRQDTWFKRYPDALRIDICKNTTDDIVKLLLKSLDYR